MIYKRFCVYCGKETGNLIENLCIDCYKKLKEIKKTIKKIKICKICGKVFYKNREIDENKLNDILKEGDIEKTYFLCKKCKIIHSKKYNAIIQLRNILEDDLNNILNFLNKEKIQIKKIDQINEKAIDLYVYLEGISLKKYIKFLKKNKFYIKLTRKLKTYDAQHGKKIYILTILIQK